MAVGRQGERSAHVAVGAGRSDTMQCKGGDIVMHLSHNMRGARLYFFGGQPPAVLQAAPHRWAYESRVFPASTGN
jgi:hypothetical protein